MVMPFPLAHPDIVDGFEVGDEVLFQIVVGSSGGATLVDMTRVPAFSGPFPDFVLSTLAGESLDSSVLDGKVAIVNFWASWCAPCKEEMPMLVDLYDEYRDAGLEIVGITEDPENAADIAAQIDEFDIPYPIVMGDGEIEEAVGGVFSIPTTFILDRTRNVVYKHIGLAAREELRRVIDDLL
jgi:thiol-disulfide isomerase/thioredoxin